MRHGLLTLSLIIICIASMAQAPVIEWEKSLGGSDYDAGWKIRQTADGGYIVAGNSFSTDGHITNQHGIYDGWLVKLRADRSIEWQKCLGGSNDDGAYHVEQTSDQGYIVAGFTKSNDGDITQMKGIVDFWFVKTDAAGNIQWQKTYGGSGSEVAMVIKEVPGNGYIAAGYTLSSDGDVSGHHKGGQDYWLIKLDKNGQKQWDKCYGGSDDDFCYSLDLVPGGGYILSGNSRSLDGDVTGGKGGYDLWVVKTDHLGNLLWQKTYGGTQSEHAGEIKVTSDGGYILVGATESANGDLTGNEGGIDGLVLKLDASGNKQWLWQAGGNKTDHFSTVVEKNGQYIVAGSTESTSGTLTTQYGHHDCYVLQLSATGTKEWAAHYGGNMLDDIQSISTTADGGFVFTGTSFSTNQDVSTSYGAGDVWVVKIKVQAPLPTVDLQPADADACMGSQAVFTLTGSHVTDYQWQIWNGAAWQALADNANYQGTKTNQLTVLGAATAEKYRCVLKNAVGETVSNVVELSAFANPTISITPLASSVCGGIPVDFTATATGGGTYTWQKNTVNGWQDIGHGGTSYKIAAAVLADQGLYRCVIQNVCGTAISNISDLEVTDCQHPIIAIQPENQSTCNGSNAIFTITAHRVESYGWQALEAGIWQSLTDNAVYSGSQTHQLEITNAQPAHALQYRCVLKNVFGETASSQARLEVKQKPAITIAPFALDICSGANAVFTATATAANHFAWQKNTGNNWQNIGGDNHTFTITASALGDMGQYRCTATNDCGSTASNTVSLQVSDCRIPNAFSPNGDGINDIWAIYFLQNHPECSVRVFSRDGALVFESKGYSKPWDGSSKGRPLPAGVYYYIITTTAMGILKGSVLVLR